MTNLTDNEILVTKTSPSGWFFAEWISIIGTFIICFVFLFYQNQVQSARSDRLYEMFCELQKQMKDESKDFHARLCIIEERNKK